MEMALTRLKSDLDVFQEILLFYLLMLVTQLEMKVQVFNETKRRDAE